MKTGTYLIYHPMYDGRGFTPMSGAWGRYKAGRELFERLGLIAPEGPVQWAVPKPALDSELLRAHTLNYLQRVHEADERGQGMIDSRDTPAWQGVERRARLSVGGTLLGVRMLATGQMRNGLHPAGGLHHARAEQASGFCVFNDMVVAVRALKAEFGMERVALVDVDGHHGDGTQALLYEEPVLKISLHQYDGRFYPGSGNVDEMGSGPGYGYAVNVPLRRNTGHTAYLRVFDAIVPSLLRAYRPQLLLVQFGADGHFNDPLVSLRLTTATYAGLVQRLNRLAQELCAGRLLLLGGGGYHPNSVARCWAIALAELTGGIPEGREEAFYALFDDVFPPEDLAATEAVQPLIDEVRQRFFPLFGINGW